MKAFRSLMVAAVLVLLLPAFALAGGRSESAQPAMSSSSSGAKVELTGAGASFPYPVYSKMFDAYFQANGIKVNYQSIGSSGGIKNIKDKVVDFGASDAYLSDSDMSSFGAPVVHIPTVLGAIVVTYNLAGSPTLRLSGDVVADIFLGKITRWNDPRITGVNPGVSLPNADIIVVHRSDGSGTTYNFTYYLSAVSADWRAKVGTDKSVNWPVGLGGAQNSGVAALVTQTPSSIGYVELAYADQNKLPYATIKNAAGNWIVPSLDSTSLAANTTLPDDTRIALGNTSATDGYPISTFTWLIIYKEQAYGGRSMQQATETVHLLWWVTHEGQQYAKPLEYAPLPDAAVKKVETILKSVTYNGSPILK
jgi:phosphate transport system substrate-binding protein